MSTAEFGELIDREHDFLQQLAMKLTKRHDDAQDLIQDTYFKALKNKDKFATGTNLKGLIPNYKFDRPSCFSVSLRQTLEYISLRQTLWYTFLSKD